MAGIPTLQQTNVKGTFICATPNVGFAGAVKVTFSVICPNCNGDAGIGEVTGNAVANCPCGYHEECVGKSLDSLKSEVLSKI